MKKNILSKSNWIYLLIFSLLSVIIASCGNNPIKPSGPAFSMVSPFEYVTLGTPGNGNGQFNQPTDLAFDKSGNIYVMDNANQRVQVFYPNGNYLTSWGSVNGWGIAVDSNNYIYVTGSASNTIYKFSSSGSPVTQWGSLGGGNGQFDSPNGIAIDANNNIFVSEEGGSGYGNRVQKFNANGQFILKWGSQGSGEGQFNAPQQVAVDQNGNIYVVDRDNHRIQKFDNYGNYLTQWGNQSELPNPGGIAVDGNENVYIVNNSLDQVQKFDMNGNFILKWGSAGTALGQYQDPAYARIDKNNNFYVADELNNRIQMTSYPYAFSDLDIFGIFSNPVKSGQVANFEMALNPSSGFSIIIKDSQGTVVNQYQGQVVSNPSILQWNMTSSDGTLADPGTYFVFFQSGSIQKNQQLTYVR